MPITTAIKATSFIDSIGVNVHMKDTGSAYGDRGLIKSELAYLGVDNVRDMLPAGGPVAALKDLAASGIEIDLIIGSNPNYQFTQSSLAADLAAIREVASVRPGAVDGLEALNEPYNFPNWWNGQKTDNWQTVFDLQKVQFAAVNADPVLRDIPFLSTSADPDKFPGTPPNFAPYADLGNAHIYPYSGMQAPHSMGAILDGQRQMVPGKPIWITEIGYGTSPGDHGWGVDEQTQAENTLNALLEAYSQGVERTYIYRLNDYAHSSGNAWDVQGLFRPDGSAKQAATAIHNLTTVLKDTGATAESFTTERLDYTIQGLPGTADSLLMQKSDGTFNLVLWNNATNWNPNTGSPIQVAPQEVTIALGAAADISIFDPMVGTGAISSSKGTTSFHVGLTDHPIIVEIDGTGTGTGGGGGTGVGNPADVAVGSGPDQLMLKISGDAYANGDATSDAAGHAVFTVSVDGKQIGNTFTALATHGAGQTQNFILNGYFGSGNHTVAVNFLNDAWAGSAATDRNLYVDAVSYRGANTNQSAAMLSTGAVNFAVTGGTAQGGGGSGTGKPSPDDTVIAAGSTQGITDAKGNVWTIKNGKVAVNGVADAITADVTKLAYVKGQVWQENSYHDWWSKTAPTDTWGPAGGTKTPPISISVAGGGQSKTVDGTVAHAETAAGASINLSEPGVAAAVIGSTAATLKFLNMKQVSVTGGAAAANVGLNGGTLNLSTGKGLMNVIGGKGVDVYAYHAGSGKLTIADFSLAQGDKLKIDKALQGAMTAGSDGAGGTLLSFGGLAAGIDLKGVTVVPSSGISFV